MENEIEKPQKLKKSKTKMQSIRFIEDDYFVLQNIAKSKGKKFSTLIRECCIAYLRNSCEHEDLLDSLKPEDPEELQKTFFDALNNSNTVVLKTLENLQKEISKNFELLELLQRKAIYLQFYISQAIPLDNFHERDEFAKRWTKDFLDDIDARINHRSMTKAGNRERQAD